WPYPGRYRVAFLANRDDELAFFPLWVQQAPAMPEPQADDTADAADEPAAEQADAAG
ncbi:MAG: hypothetical protein JOZ24_00370, partial [Candidatus Eremiobacteraeota bacterium]|nr:hypothetical protein [Candidatus Eremiobacteraeota bacterium]